VDDRRVHHQVDALVVVDEAVGLAAVDDGLAQVLLGSKHGPSNPWRFSTRIILATQAILPAFRFVALFGL
jgi:hypothetical protein